jgi:protein-S-isoprenylcysteine O-methyltransferase Ste14
MAVVRTVGWVAAVIYCTIPSLWLVIHPRPGFWRGRARSPLRLVGLIWLLLWIAAGAITWPWRTLALYTTPLAWIPAAPLFAVGLFLYAKGRQRFSTDQVLGRAELHPEHHEQRLVTTGIRGRMRHPYYVAHFCELLAWSLGTALVVIYAMLAFAVITGLVMVRAEERELELRFGEEYRTYRRRVPAFVPRVRSRRSTQISGDEDPRSSA